MAGRLYLYVGDKSAWRDVGAAGCLALDSACDANLPGQVLGRDMVAFPDSIALPPTEQGCFEFGKRLAESMFARHPKRLWGRMGPNEQHPKDSAMARRWGALEGGVAQVTWRCLETYVGLNCSYGTLEADRFCDWLQAFVLWAKPGNSPWLVGYHGYTDGKTDAYYLAQRPWTLWKPYLEQRGLRLPRMMMTEAGYDKGPTDPPYCNGYKANLSSEDYATYLRGLPLLVPECEAFCIYLSGTIDPDKWWSFDVADDSVVLAAIRETNRRETPMSQTIVKTPEQLAHEIWDSAWRWRDLPGAVGYNPDCAIGQYRESNALLGMPLSGEFDRPPPRENELLPAPWPYVCQVFSGGIVLARKGDWKTTACGSREQVLRAITSYIAPLA